MHTLLSQPYLSAPRGSESELKSLTDSLIIINSRQHGMEISQETSKIYFTSILVNGEYVKSPND